MNSTANQHLTRIQQLFDQGQYSLAAEEIVVALRNTPNDPALQLISAKLDFVDQQFDKALRKLKWVTQVQSDWADAYHLMGVILSQIGRNDPEQHDAAVRALERAYQQLRMMLRSAVTWRV